MAVFSHSSAEERPMRWYQAYDIKYNTDGTRVKDIPTTLDFKAKNLEEAREIASEKVAGTTGWLVEELCVKPLKKTVS